MIQCAGCEREALYEVYKDIKQPHCLEHMLEAIDCSEFVYVRRLDELEYKATTALESKG